MFALRNTILVEGMRACGLVDNAKRDKIILKRLLNELYSFTTVVKYWSNQVLS